MEKTLEKTEDKIQKICDALKRETLEPAKEEAERIIADAKHRAERIISEAKSEAEQIHATAKEKIEQERNVFHSSLEQAGKQCLEEVKQVIEHRLFSDQLEKLVVSSTSKPDVMASLVKAIVDAIDKDGITAELTAVVPQTVSVNDVNRELGEGVLKKLKEGSVVLGEFGGGAQVKIINKKMTIDITDSALEELLSRYVRKDFRKLLFQS